MGKTKKYSFLQEGKVEEEEDINLESCVGTPGVRPKSYKTCERKPSRRKRIPNVSTNSVKENRSGLPSGPPSGKKMVE